jgi:uncharacterized protein
MEQSQGEQVGRFLEARVYAVVGTSPNREKYGHKVYEDLKRGGYEVYPINPSYDDIDGETCYPDLHSLPCKPDVVEFVCPPPVTERVVEDMVSLGIDKAWMQPGAESEEAINTCLENGISVLHDVCIMVERKRR